MNVAKGRLTQTFKFLKELNELRNPVPREISGYAKLLWIYEWPTHPFVEVRLGDRGEEDEGDVQAELEPLIRIRRANLTPCPKPPEVLDGWLKPGWQFVETEAEVLTSRNFPDKDKGSVAVAFEDDARRAAARSLSMRMRQSVSEFSVERCVFMIDSPCAPAPRAVD
jgi:hypothetical protein